MVLRTSLDLLSKMVEFTYISYQPDKKHFNTTWKDKNGTTITEKGFVGTKEAWSPAVLIICYVLAGLCLSTCIVFCALYKIYDGHPFDAFKDEFDPNDYQN